MLKMVGVLKYNTVADKNEAEESIYVFVNFVILVLQGF